MAIASVNPATGEIIQTFAPLTELEISEHVAQAEQAFRQYRHTTFEQRSQWLHCLAELLMQGRLEYAKQITLEMGKPISEAIAEVEKSALVCRFYADHGAEYLADQPVVTEAKQSFIRYQPLGIILAVMPWNFPFWQVFRFAAPALMAGNVGLLKHASNVPQSALKIAELFAQAGFPAGVFQTLLIGAAQVAPLVADPRIKAATLTGSEPAGASLAALCGQQIKKTVLELGGSDPFVVMPSADLALAAATAVKARMINSGQTCVAAKRFIVAESIAESFQAQFVLHVQALQLGDPFQPNTQIGPLATPNILAEITHQVQMSVEYGAKVLVGGESLKGSPKLPPALQAGNFYSPTILANVTPDNPIYSQELFGPVAMILPVPDLEAALEVANATPFGLAASVWTNDAQEQARLVNEIEAGAVFVNSMVKSDPRVPFGGIKRSGYGRELGGAGIHEFVNIKTIWINS